MHNVRFKAFLIAGLLSVAALAADKDSKDSRPARGSVELGKGPGAQTSGSKVDELNNLFGKVVEAVTPSVVTITTEKKWAPQQQQFNNPLFEFFGMPQPEAP